MTWTTGQKADATIVANAVRDRYSNPAKDAIRSWVIAELKVAEPTLVLDLWGGGRSADEMTAAGLAVLSVDDGRGFADHGITKVRARRALEIKAEAGGYRAGWGSVARYAAECDAAWLDFMGHLCGATVRVLTACRRMKAVAITLMPDRMAGVTNLPVEAWTVAYRSIIEHYTGLRVRHIPRKYRREGGQWVLIFLARAPTSGEERRRSLARAKWTDPKTQRSLYEARRPGYQKALNADPEHRERSRAAIREWSARHPEHRKIAAAAKRAMLADPEYLAKCQAKRRAYGARPEEQERRREYERARATDPERVAHRKAVARARHQTSEWKERNNARQRARYANDPDYRARAQDASARARALKRAAAQAVAR